MSVLSLAICMLWVSALAQGSTCTQPGECAAEQQEQQELQEPRQVCEAAEALVADVPLYGFHLICFQNIQTQPSLRASVHVFLDSTNNTDRFDVAISSWESFSVSVSRWLTVAPEEALWAVFSPEGERIVDTTELLSLRVAYLITGGNFVWPGVRIGHTQEVGAFNLTLQTLSLQPLVFQVSNLLSEKECSYILSEALPHLEPSWVSKQDNDHGKEDTTWRTSETYFMDSQNRPPMKLLDERIARLTHIPTEHQEHAQVLRYKQSGKYDAHHDFFDYRLYTKDPSTLRILLNGARNRMLTVLWYLNDVSSGGETVFPRAGAQPSPSDMTDCTKGLKVLPRLGNAVLFYNMLPSGRSDEYSLHGACRVYEGEKWAANKWVWNRPIDFGPGPAV